MILDDIVQNFEKINRHFGLELWESSKCFRGKCPIHEGDNKSSLTIYKDGHTSPGNWKCFTGNCQEEYGGSVIGFISAILSVRGNRKVSRQEAISWCESFFGSKYQAPDNSFDNKLTNFINRSALPANYSFRLSPEDFLSKLKPPKYFIDRQYKEKTLSEFKVGYCDNKTKPFYDRVVVPQIDEEGYIIACLGRSVHEKCPHCKEFHNPEGICRTFPKWKNSENFPSYNALYNFYNAKKDIDDTGLIIVTESSANTWRLFEAGFTMSVGTFGSKFSDAQKSLLDSSLAQTVIVVPDAGLPGQILVKHVQEHCQFTHNIITISPSYEDDIGKCNIETVKKIIGPYVDKKLG
jgi:DNA primase